MLKRPARKFPRAFRFLLVSLPFALLGSLVAPISANATIFDTNWSTSDLQFAYSAATDSTTVSLLETMGPSLSCGPSGCLTSAVAITSIGRFGLGAAATSGSVTSGSGPDYVGLILGSVVFSAQVPGKISGIDITAGSSTTRIPTQFPAPTPDFGTSNVRAYYHPDTAYLDYDLLFHASGIFEPGQICDRTTVRCEYALLYNAGPGVQGQYVKPSQVIDSSGSSFSVHLSGQAFAPYARGLSVDIAAYAPGSPSNNYPVQWQRSPLGRVPVLSTYSARGGGNPSVRGCQCGASDPVATATGEFYQTETDLTLAGSGPTVGISRTYSSFGATQDGPFGFGWSPNFATHLAFSDLSNGPSDDLPDQVQVFQENGSVTTFTEAPDGTYPPDPGVTATLTKDATSGIWTFVRNKTGSFTFDTGGLLLSISDAHAVAVTFGRDSSGRVTSIGSSGGRKISLTWSGDHVVSATDSATRSVSYSYDGTGNLSSSTGADGTVTKYGYDSSSRMTSLTKPDGGVTSNTYDASGRVSKQTDPIGRVTAFAYDANATTVTAPDGLKEIDEYASGVITKITKAAGTALQQLWTYQYDSDFNRTVSTDPMGRSTTSTFDADGNSLTVTDSLGRTTASTFNAFGEPLTVKDPLNRVTTFSYNPTGDLVSTTSPSGATTSHTFAPDGVLTSSVDALNKGTTFTNDGRGLPLCTTDPDSRKWCTAYSAAGFPTSETDPAGKATTKVFDPAGRVTSSIDPLGKVTKRTYDGVGRLLTVTDPLGRVTATVYDAAGQVTSSTTPAGKSTVSYDTAGRISRTTDPLGRSTITAYNVAGWKSSVTDPLGRVTKYSYDLAGRPITTTLPSGATLTATYDEDGQLVSSTDAAGKVTTFTHDAAGQVVKTVDPLGRATATEFNVDSRVMKVTSPDGKFVGSTYDAAGNLTNVTDADGHPYSYSYDAAGLLVSQTVPGSGTSTFTYDAAGRLSSTTRGDGSVVGEAHDAAGHLTTVDYPGTGADVSYAYDAAGQRLSMTDGTGKTTYSYTSTGLLASTTNGAGAALAYTYDAAGQRTAVTYPGSKKVSYGYDAAGQMTALTDWSARTTSFTWTSDGKLATRVDPGTVTENRTYDANNRLTQSTLKTGSNATATYKYGYDAAGQIVSDVTTDPLVSSKSRSYSYDKVGQLATRTTGSTVVNWTTSSAGVLSMVPGATLTTNSAEQVTKYAPDSGAETTFAYTPVGSRASATTASTPATATTYSYSPAGDLVAAVTGSVSTTYAADGDGLRQSVTRGSTISKFLWDTASELPLLLKDESYSYIYGPDSTPVEAVENSTGTASYLHEDVIGSVRLATSTTGAVVAVNEFNSYGALGSHSGTTFTIGYSGNWKDPTTKLVYLRARDYDPMTGQFLQVDPAIDLTRQPYAYANNDPLARTDPTGLCDGMPGTPPGRTCDANDYFWSSDAQAKMWGQVGNNFANMAYGIADTITYNPLLTLLGASSWSELWRHALVPNIECYTPTNGFHTFASVWTGLAVGGIAGAMGAISGGLVATGTGGARFAVNAAGEATMSLRAGSTSLEVSEHAALRLTQRGISIDEAEATLAQDSFQYLHQNVWKTGYYDSTTRIFLGSVSGKVTTVIKDASLKYINNLKAAKP